MIVAGNNQGKSIEEIQREQERMRVVKYMARCATLQDLQRVEDVVEELDLSELYRQTKKRLK